MPLAAADQGKDTDMLRLGLCCLFVTAPIAFRRTTATYQATLRTAEQRRRLAALSLHNAGELLKALTYCRDAGIGAFRINSQILPLITHPQVGYRIEDLPGSDAIIDAYRQCGAFARRNDIRTSFHPDQFVVLNALRADVRRKSIEELVYQSMVARWVGADVINVHAGGAYGDKPNSLQRLAAVLKALPNEVVSRLTLENDDRVYSPADLLPICRETGIPLVYDVHHHRCLPDRLSVEDATLAALATWNREPLFHVSSPLDRRRDPVDRRHADHVDPADLPACWRSLDLTVEVEAKAKELAVEKLRSQLAR